MSDLYTFDPSVGLGLAIVAVGYLLSYLVISSKFFRKGR